MVGSPIMTKQIEVLAAQLFCVGLHFFPDFREKSFGAGQHLHLTAALTAP